LEPARCEQLPQANEIRQHMRSVHILESLLLDAIRQRNVRTKHNDMKTKNALVKAVATDETIEQMLWDCLAEAPFIETQKVEQRVIADPERPEIVARIRIGGQERLLLAEVKSNGQPRLVREAVESLTKYRQTYADSYGLVIAPSFTPQAIKICRQEGVGYLDFSGNCLLNFDFVFINKAGRIATGTKRKNFRSWYSPRIERVLRTIFMLPQRVWKIRELALEAHVTAGQAFSIKRHLGERGWLEEFKHGFALARPDLLLDEWSENYLSARNVERVFSSRRTVIEIEAMLASICQEQIIPKLSRHSLFQRRMLGLRQIRIIFQQLQRIILRHSQQFHLLRNIRQLELRKPVLPRPKKIPRPAQFQIDLGNLKSIIAFRHRIQPARRLFTGGVRDQQTIRFRRPAPDSPSNLMQLR